MMMSEMIKDFSNNRKGEPSTNGNGGGGTDSSSKTETKFSPLAGDKGTQVFHQLLIDYLDSELPPLRRESASAGAVSASLANSASYLEPREPSTARPKGRPAVIKGGPRHTVAQLNRLAYTFSQSEERKKVKELANTMDLDLCSDEFGSILTTMVSASEHADETFIVVMFFCLDIGKRLLGSGLNPYTNILKLCYKAVQSLLGTQESGPRNDWEGTAV